MGRKRHLLVDTQGFALKVVVSAADVQDRDGARLVAHALHLYGPVFPRLRKVWADAAYSGPLGEELRAWMGWDLEIVQRADTQPKGDVRRAGAPLAGRTDLRLVARIAALEPRLRVPSRVERSADLRRHDPPHAAADDPPRWLTFKTVS